MGTSRIVVVAAMAALSLSACASQAPEGVDVSSLDQKCAAISDTGDMYRYCLQEGPAQVALVSHPSRDVAASVLPR